MKLVNEKNEKLDGIKIKNGSKNKEMKIKKEVKVKKESGKKNEKDMKGKKDKISEECDPQKSNEEVIKTDLSDPNKMKMRIDNVKAIICKNEKKKWMWSPLLRTMILKDFSRRIHFNFIKNIPKPIESVNAFEPLYNDCLDIKINKGLTSTKHLQNFSLRPVPPPHEILKRYTFNMLRMQTKWKGPKIDKLHVQRFISRGLLIHLGQLGFVDVSQKTLNIFVSIIYDYFQKMCETLRILSNIDVINSGAPYNMITVPTLMKFLSLNNSPMYDLSFYLMSNNKHLELQAMKQVKFSLYKMKKAKNKIKNEPLLTSSQLKAHDQIPQIHITSTNEDIQSDLLMLYNNLEKDQELQNLIN